MVLLASPFNAARATENPTNEAQEKPQARRRAAKKYDRKRPIDAMAGNTDVMPTMVDKQGDIVMRMSIWAG